MHRHPLRGFTAVSRATLAASLLFVVAVSGVVADEKLGHRPNTLSPAQAEDEKAIRAIGMAITKAFNAGDAKAIAALWAPDGDYVDDKGKIVRGREAIEKEYTQVFAGQRGHTVECTVDSLRFLGKEAALVNGVARVKPATGGPALASRFTAVHVKRDGKWLIESIRESPYLPTSNYEYLSDLEWLIGSWSAQTGDLSLEAKFDWTAGRNFILGTLTQRGSAGVVSTSTRVIGWDPTLGQVRSWAFDSDGGFGGEMWTRDGKRWVLHGHGVRRDGAKTEATNLLTTGDVDSFTWQSVGRKLDDVRLPDTAAVKAVRVKAKP